jgi:hypothetical protein
MSNIIVFQINILVTTLKKVLSNSFFWYTINLDDQVFLTKTTNNTKDWRQKGILGTQAQGNRSFLMAILFHARSPLLKEFRSLR